MSSQPSQQKGLLPPASPAYVLRGHAAPIHALNFFAHNEHLLSGDADGWVVIWSLVTKRPTAVWKAHEGAILEAKGFYYEESREMEIFTYVNMSRPACLVYRSLPSHVSLFFFKGILISTFKAWS